MIDKISIFTVSANAGNMTDIQTVSSNFDQFGEGDESTTWWASDYMVMLGYPNMTSFANVINRAMQACLTAKIDSHDNFMKTTRQIGDRSAVDYRLTRFACYMIAMNGDTKKPQIAGAQAFFAKTVEQVSLILEGANDVERLVTRSEVIAGNKSLAAAAKAAGVVTSTEFAIFQDHGYIGMYNMGMKKLCKVKGVPDSLYEYMGRIELSANALRIALTEEQLKKRGTNRAFEANRIHKNVGEDIRKVVKNNTGVYPENLPVERKLNEVNKQLKSANKLLNKKKK
ncbi:DNA damage-inducible protein D [Spirosoma migulaei]